VVIIGIILAIGIPYYLAYKRGACDTTAQSDIEKLSPALVKLAGDLSRFGCKSTLDGITWTPAMIANLAGRYYGWYGTSRKCDVRLWYSSADKSFKAAVWNGTLPSGNKRFVFSIPQDGGPELPTGTEDVDASAQQYQYNSALTTSMVDSNCTNFGGLY
jgi:hypothetical protein